MLVAIVGGVFGAATYGVVDIPGISPQKFGKVQVASAKPVPGFLSTFALPLKNIETSTQSAQAAIKPPAAVLEPKGPKPDPALGDEKLAELWNSLDPDKLVAITAKWSPNNLARILIKMDSDQVSQYLAALKTDRAVQLSKAIQQSASLPLSNAGSPG